MGNCANILEYFREENADIICIGFRLPHKSREMIFFRADKANRYGLMYQKEAQESPSSWTNVSLKRKRYMTQGS